MFPAVIVGTGNSPDDKLVVQKSLPLLSLWQSDMTLPEFKILDAYLSRINSHEPTKRTVLFTKGELEQVLHVKKINKKDLEQRLKNLYRGVELTNEDNKIHTIALFEEAYGERNEFGTWTIRLTCTAAAMKYIFNIENIGYLRYGLDCVANITSRYAYILFLYLERNRFRKTWEIELNELRQMLKCESASYDEYKIFNNRILNAKSG